MSRFGLGTEVVDPGVLDRSARRLGQAGVVLPTFGELADPTTIPSAVREHLGGVDPDTADPANLFRVHWHNAPDRRSTVEVPDHVVLPPSLTGVEAPIVVAFGDRFPMIRAHKVLAAYACLVPRLVTGAFDPATQRAVWPSTGNYCRGGAAISRILGCRGVAVLPEGMSRERFDWLQQWVTDPDDVIRTPGTESNVKEIYDRCAELEREPDVVVFNQFAEFGNHLVHELVTGRALGRVVDHLRDGRPGLRVHAFVSATGSAGTIAAGDHLKEREGAQIVAVEALECPTLTENGFGEHNIQGIGDKHVPLIHNVMNTDLVVAVSDRGTDGLNVVFNTPVGRRYLAERRGVPDDVIAALDSFGLSSICNVLAAIRVAHHDRLGPDDLLVTVATDGAAMYTTERDKAEARDFPHGFDEAAAAEAFGRHVLGGGVDRVTPLSEADRRRIFNLGYFTWVEQQGVSFEAFVDRRSPAFWAGLRELVPAWDELIASFNERSGASPVPGSAGAPDDHSFAHLPTAFLCGGCGFRSAAAAPVPMRCPVAAPGDDIDHVLRRVVDPARVAFPTGSEPNPFLRYRTLFHAYHVARAIGWSDADYVALVERLDRAVATVDGHGFETTPLVAASALAGRLGIRGGLLVKDETHNVSGSHKARHLMGTALELEVGETLERTRAAEGGLNGGEVVPARLAIASCGNAALAAAVVARAWGRELHVFVPADADPVVLDRLSDLRAVVTIARRERGVPGDPTYHALRRAVAEGAVPFTCQGNENGLALEGGLTLGYELADDLQAADRTLDRLFVQVGGGALASSVAQALDEAVAFGVLGRVPRIHAVQSEGARPLIRAYDRVVDRLAVRLGLDPGAVAAGRDAAPAERHAVAERMREALNGPRGAAELARIAHHRSAFMWPWEDEPRSVAGGILDDETYDWFAVVGAMLRTGGYPVVASEEALVEANEVGREATGIDVDHTGSAGLAGLIELRRTGAVAPDETVAVLFTGIRRAIPPAQPVPHTPVNGGER